MNYTGWIIENLFVPSFQYGHANIGWFLAIYEQYWVKKKSKYNLLEVTERGM